jgi:hypothetical protein
MPVGVGPPPVAGRCWRHHRGESRAEDDRQPRSTGRANPYEAPGGPETHDSRERISVRFFDRGADKHATRTVLPVMAADRVGFLQMSPTSYQQWGKEEVRLHPVGTGPFKLAKWEPNQVIVLEKNPHYFKPGLPYLDCLELRIMKERVTRVTALRAGAEASLPIIATVMKTQLAQSGVEVTVEVLDRPIFLRRVARDRDWDQFVRPPAGSADLCARL